MLAPFFDLGFSPDPVGEHLAALRRLQALDPHLILPGTVARSQKPRALLQANLDGIEERVARLESEIRAAPGTGWELFVRVHGGSLDPSTRVWRIWESAAYMDHLVCSGRVVEQEAGGGRLPLRGRRAPRAASAVPEAGLALGEVGLGALPGVLGGGDGQEQLALGVEAVVEA